MWSCGGGCRCRRRGRGRCTAGAGLIPLWTAWLARSLTQFGLCSHCLVPFTKESAAYHRRNHSNGHHHFAFWRRGFFSFWVLERRGVGLGFEIRKLVLSFFSCFCGYLSCERSTFFSILFYLKGRRRGGGRRGREERGNDMLILSLSSSSSLYCTRCVCGYLCNEIGRCFFLFFLLSFFFFTCGFSLSWL